MMMYPHPVLQEKKNAKGFCACACGCRRPHEDVRWKGYYLCGGCWGEMNSRYEELIRYPVPKHP